MGFNTRKNAPSNSEKPFRYWAQLAAIKCVMRDAEDPATVLDALFEPMQSPGLVKENSYKPTGKPVGRPKKG